MKSNFPEGWSVTTLDNVADILDNIRVPVNSDERARRQGDVPYYGATGQVGWIDDFLFNEEIVLLGEDAAPFFDKSKNVAFLVSGKSWVNNHAHVLRAKSAVTSNKYLLYFLNQLDYKEYVNGTTRLKLTQGSMKTIPVLLPPIAEQHRIVAQLEAIIQKLEASQERLEKLPALLKKFRQAVLAAAVSGKLTEAWRTEQHQSVPLNQQTLFDAFLTLASQSGIPDSWVTTTFGSVLKSGPQNGLYKPQTDYGTGSLILRIDNFYDGSINAWSSLKRVSIDVKEAALYGLNNNDIVINRVNSMSHLGKSALVRELPEPCVFESNMMRCTLNVELANPEYIIHYLNSIQGISELRKNAK